MLQARSMSVSLSAMLILLLVGQALDASTFLWFYRIAPPGVLQAERNPLLVAVMALGGVAAVALLKVGVAAWVAWRAHGRPLRHRRLFGSALALAAASGFIGAAFNTYAIVEVLRA